MKQLQQFIQHVKIQSRTRGIQDVMGLYPVIQAYSGNDWYDYMQFENYRPKNTILFQDESVKVMMIYWSSYKQSKKHGHPEGGGLIKVLAGTLKETRFDPQHTERIIGRHHYVKGDTSYIHDDLAYHIVQNPSMIPAISLHVYSPGIYSSNIISSGKDFTGQKEVLRTAA